MKAGDLRPKLLRPFSHHPIKLLFFNLMTTLKTKFARHLQNASNLTPFQARRRQPGAEANTPISSSLANCRTVIRKHPKNTGR